MTLTDDVNLIECLAKCGPGFVINSDIRMSFASCLWLNMSMLVVLGEFMTFNNELLCIPHNRSFTKLHVCLCSALKVIGLLCRNHYHASQTLNMHIRLVQKFQLRIFMVENWH